MAHGGEVSGSTVGKFYSTVGKLAVLSQRPLSGLSLQFGYFSTPDGYGVLIPPQALPRDLLTVSWLTQEKFLESNQNTELIFHGGDNIVVFQQ